MLEDAKKLEVKIEECSKAIDKKKDIKVDYYKSRTLPSSTDEQQKKMDKRDLDKARRNHDIEKDVRHG